MLLLREANCAEADDPGTTFTIATMIFSSIHYIKALHSFGGKAQ